MMRLDKARCGSCERKGVNKLKQVADNPCAEVKS